jgi:hypothetical protein
MMNRHKIPMLILISLTIFLTSVLFIVPFQSGYLLTTAREGHPLVFFPSNDKVLTIAWRHSVELQPWMEIYKVDSQGMLSLEETRFKAYGAGVPAVDGKVVTNENGFFVVRGIKRHLEKYSLFYTPSSSYSLQMGGEKYMLKDYVPADTGVYVAFTDLTLAEFILIKVQLEVVA